MNFKKLFWIVIAGGLVGWTYFSWVVGRAEATFNPQVTICHKPSNPDQTLTVSLAALGAHLAHGDSLGACSQVTPTPTVTPSPTPVVPTPTPETEGECEEGYHLSDYGNNHYYEEEECVPDEEPTPTPTNMPEQPLTPAGAGPAPACASRTIAIVPQNFHVLRNGSQAILKWVPTGGDLVNVYFKEVGQASWTHGLGDQQNDGYLEINALDPRLGYEFAVQQHEGCGGGELSPKAVVMDPPTTQWTLFTQTSWE